MPTVPTVSATHEAYERGQAALSQRDAAERKALGQFMTAPPVARLMADALGDLADGARLLEPAIGSGVLACAVAERAARVGTGAVRVVGYDVDEGLASVARTVLDGTSAEVGVTVGDFMVAASQRSDTLFSGAPDGLGEPFDAVVANPPYVKLNRSDERLQAAEAVAPAAPNAYAVFVTLALARLRPGGRAVFLLPRSFCSGAYFGRFRDGLLRRAVIERLHLFDARDDAFDRDGVLQENVVLVMRRAGRGGDGASEPCEPATVEVSISYRGADLSRTASRSVPWDLVAGQRGGHTFFRIPTSELDELTVRSVERWPASLGALGLHVSTGPVVPFRAKPLLASHRDVSEGRAVPLLWMQNVRTGEVVWPTERGRKPQGLRTDADGGSLLTPPGNAVLLRRFSGKEERRRLTAAPLLSDEFGGSAVAVENHLNVIRPSSGAGLSVEMARGLTALLGSALLDRYFRVLGGHTQVNAGELRALPFPRAGTIRRIGEAVVSGVEPDQAVYATLRSEGLLHDDLPAITETRLRMGKIDEAQDLLKTLGMPRRQHNEMAALTLLTLAQLSEPDSWASAQRRSLGVHDVMGEMRTRYDRDYAENTRETVRRHVIHQFVQAGIVERNPDDPALPTNSPRTHYALSDAALRAVRAYDSDGWNDAATAFLEEQPSLLSAYRAKRDQHKVALRLPSGEEYHLSPGAHNVLQAAVIEEFGPRFAPGARVLYVGDTADKTLHLDEEGFAEIGVPVPSHDKLPDVVLYDPENGWLYLIEAVTSHGPVSPKRVVELRMLMTKDSEVGVVFVSAFPDVSTFKTYLADIAWETEVWIADQPTHLIHFDGDRFLGPHE